MNDGLDGAAGNERPYLANHVGHDRGLLLGWPRPQRRRHDGGPLGEQSAEVDLGLGPALEADDDKATGGVQDGNIGGEILSAHIVEDDIRTGVLLAHHVGEVLFAIIDADVGTQVRAERKLLGAAGGDRNTSAERLGQLDRHRADATAAPVDEKRFTMLELAHHEDVGPHRGGHLHESGRIDEADTVRHSSDLSGGDSHVLGISTAGEERADLVADLELGDTFADGFDGPGAFESEYGCRPRRRVVQALALQQVGTVHARCGNLDEDFARTGFGVGLIDEGEGVNASGLPDNDCTHAHTVVVRLQVVRTSAFLTPAATMRAMHIALVQFAAATDSAANRAVIDDMLNRLGPADGLDLVVLPEGSMHDFGTREHDLSAIAETLDGPFVQLLGGHARRLGATVVGGMFEATDGLPAKTPAQKNLPFNTLVVLGPDGSLRHTYRKIHLYDSFGYRESERLSPGDVTPLVIDVAGRAVGLMTCYDLRFPELARILIEAGAEVLAIPSAWVQGELKLDHWTTLLRARAIENTVPVIAVGQCGEHYAGHSMVIDARGSIVEEAGSVRATLHAELDFAEVERVRADNPSLTNRRIRSAP